MSQTTYEFVTKQITDALERGVIPWRRPWRNGDRLPINAVSHRPYHGINVVLLSLLPFHDHRFVSYRQAEQLGGHVRRGERAATAIFWKLWGASSSDGKAEEHLSVGQRTAIPRRVPLLRTYAVFNVEQCEGLRLPQLETTDMTPHERIGAAEAAVRCMPNAPEIRECGTRACYRPGLDMVQVPPIGAFHSPDAFYATLFHELGHATGHASRLQRLGVMDAVHFGSDTYGHEELVAEFASAFCCASLGLDNSLTEQSASYIHGWLSALKHDPKAVVIAAAQAQKAADYIRGITPDA